MLIQKYICLELAVPDEQSVSSVDNGLETPSLSATNTLILTISDRQFIEFLSALEAGAEILYPDKMYDMTDLFLQAVQ